MTATTVFSVRVCRDYDPEVCKGAAMLTAWRAPLGSIATGVLCLAHRVRRKALP